MSDRLDEIEERSRLRYEIPAEDVVFAPTDIQWLIAEVKRLRQELGTWQLIHSPAYTPCAHDWDYWNNTAGQGATCKKCGTTWSSNFAPNTTVFTKMNLEG
jgi:hypothetical protein